MLDWVLMGIGLALGGGEESDNRSETAAAPSGAQTFQAENQTPTGQFTTAIEIKQIMEMTTMNWVAVRDYEGQDWLYVTHLLSWRCGMHEFRISVNGGPSEPWDMPPCFKETATPNAIKADTLIYRTYPAGHIESIAVHVLYDDLTTGQAEFYRSDVLLP